MVQAWRERVQVSSHCLDGFVSLKPEEALLESELLRLGSDGVEVLARGHFPEV